MFNKEVDSVIYADVKEIKRFGRYTLEKNKIGGLWTNVKCGEVIVFDHIDKLIDFKYSKNIVKYKYLTHNPITKNTSIISVSVENYEYDIECLKLVQFGYKKNLFKQ